MARLDFQDTDRDTDSLELRLHEASAKRGFRRGGVILAAATALLLLTGWYSAATFGIPVAVLFIGDAYAHRMKACALRARLRGYRS